MTKYVAFLRGVNVGGRVVKMADLKDCLQKAGLKEVRTFIASGNIIFSNSKNIPVLKNLLEKTLEKQFGFKIEVLIMDNKQLDKLVKSIPANWVNDKQMKCDVMLLWPEIDTKDILNQLPLTPGLEDSIYVPGALIWRIDRDKTTKSRMFKIVGTKIYKQMTVRNPNTIRKVYRLMQT